MKKQLFIALIIVMMFLPLNAYAAAPAAPTGLHVSSQNGQRVTLSWGGSPGADYYAIVTPGMASNTFTTVKNHITGTSAEIYMPSSGKVCYAVVAYKKSGDKKYVSKLSNTVCPQRGSSGAEPEPVFYNVYYQPFRDEYRVDYTYPGDFTMMRLHFTAADGNEYTLDFPPEDVTGIVYLTCNGTYTLQFLDDNQTIVAQSGPIVTRDIVNPTCQSYPGQTGGYDMSASYIDNGDGTYTLFWNDLPDAEEYEIWQGGQLLDVVSGDTYTVDEPGSVTIVARNDLGDPVGQDDLYIPDLSESVCSVCDKLDALLNCPGWDQVMGDLSQMIRDALVDFWGSVPPVPSVDDIADAVEPELPVLDIDVPDADLTPVVPEGYEQPLDFDITTGPEIPVVDESEPIEIYEPDAFIDADDPGVMVLPGDTRNSSGGIKNPDIVDTGEEMPVPEYEPPVDDPDIPPAEIPVPTLPGGGSGAVPSLKTLERQGGT